jgi:hypothetical protein
MIIASALVLTLGACEGPKRGRGRATAPAVLDLGIESVAW